MGISDDIEHSDKNEYEFLNAFYFLLIFKRLHNWSKKSNYIIIYMRPPGEKKGGGGFD